MVKSAGESKSLLGHDINSILTTRILFSHVNIFHISPKERGTLFGDKCRVVKVFNSLLDILKVNLWVPDLQESLLVEEIVL